MKVFDTDEEGNEIRTVGETLVDLHDLAEEGLFFAAEGPSSDELRGLRRGEWPRLRKVAKPETAADAKWRGCPSTMSSETRHLLERTSRPVKISLL